MNKITKKLTILGLSIVFLSKLTSQNCSASCYGCNSSSGGAITDIVIKNSIGQVLFQKYNINCIAGITVDTGKTALFLVPGEIISISVKGQVNPFNSSISSDVGVWLDANSNNIFSKSECIVSPNTGGLINCVDTIWKTANIVVPNYVSIGKLVPLRFRGIVSNYKSLNPSTGCGTVVGYGNTVDVYLNAVKQHYVVGIDTLVPVEAGIFSDNKTLSANYNNNLRATRNFMQIVCTDKISLDLIKLKFADSFDKLKIYEGYGDTGRALHPLGGWHKLNQKSAPKQITCRTSAIYITFESDSFFNDTGFEIKWRSERMKKKVLEITSYFDENRNAVWDNSEQPYNYRTIKLNGTEIFVSTINGKSKIFLNKDSVKVEIDTLIGQKYITPKSGLDTFIIGKKNSLSFGMDFDSTYIDVSPLLSNFVLRRGLKGTGIVRIRNLYYSKSDSVKCKLKFDRNIDSIGMDRYIKKTASEIEFIAANPGHFSSSSHKLTLRTKSTDTGAVRAICNCAFKGNVIEKDTQNNKDTIDIIIGRPEDPNEKLVYSKSEITQSTKKLRYTVNFQNKGTSPANTVRIEDKISEYLDENSINIIESSHSMYMERVGKTVNFIFPEIELMDLKTNEKLSIGHVTFEINIKQPFIPMKKIENTAAIYFDFEAPVVTNTTINYWKSIPLITLNGPSQFTINTCSNFTDPGATASDQFDGDISKNLVYSNSSVDITKPGIDTIWYSVTNSTGIKTTVYRTILKIKSSHPRLKLHNKTIVHNQTEIILWNSNYVDEVIVVDSCSKTRMPSYYFGFNGKVNTLKIGNYPIQYFDTNEFGQISKENGFIINYLVKDTIKPTVVFTSTDTICHQISTPYNSEKPTVADNYSSLNNISLTKSGIVDPYVVGLYIEKWEATDESGNKTVVYRYIKVGNCNLQTKSQIAKRIHLSPNPFVDFIEIKGLNSKATFQIVSLDGKVILKGNLTNNRNTIDCSYLKQGLFILNLTTNNQLYSEKIFKK